MQENQELIKNEYSNHFLNLIKEANNEIVDQINDSTIISVDDIKKLEASKEFALSTYTDVPQYRPLIVKLVSVLNDSNFPTPDSKYWQCKSEAEVHFNELNRDLNKYKRSMVDLSEIDYKIEKLKEKVDKKVDDEPELDKNLIQFDIQRLLIKKESYLFEMKQIEKRIKYRIEEISDWNVISQNLETQCEYSKNDHKEHYSKSFIKSLENKIKATSNEKEKKILTEQLNTYKRMIMEKISKKEN